MKAVLIAEDPSIVEGGKLQRKKLGPRSGHAFVDVAERVLGSLTETERYILFTLEEHVLWAGKYTVPMNAEVLYDQRSMQVLRTAPMNEREQIRGLVARLQSHAKEA